MSATDDQETVTTSTVEAPGTPPRQPQQQQRPLQENDDEEQIFFEWGQDHPDQEEQENMSSHATNSSEFDFLESLQVANFEAVASAHQGNDVNASFVIPLQPRGGGDVMQQQHPNPQQQQQQGQPCPTCRSAHHVSFNDPVGGGGVETNHIYSTKTIKQSNRTTLAAAAASAAGKPPPFPTSLSAKFASGPPPQSPPNLHRATTPPPGPSMLPRPQRIQLDKHISERRLELSDVLDANVELEAETYILESLDEQANRTAPSERKELFDETISPQIPMTIAEDYLRHQQVSSSSSLRGGGEIGVGNTVRTANTTPTRIPPKPSTTVETACGMVVPSAKSLTPPNSPGHYPNNQNRHNQLPRQSSQKHRRQKTVEEMIFGLNSSWIKIDNANLPEGGAMMPDDSIIPPSKSNDPSNQTTDLLFNRRRTRTEDSAGQPHHVRRLSPKPPSGLVASGELSIAESDDNNSNVHPHSGMHKKNDETTSSDSPQDTDIEQGQTKDRKVDGPSPRKKGPYCCGKKRGKRYNPFRAKSHEDIPEEWDVEEEFLQPKRSFLYYFAKYVVLCTIVPLIAIAFILFYAFDNPMVPIERIELSWSYLMLFIVRNLITIGLAKVAEIVVIDHLCLRSRCFINCAGSVSTLWVATSKGWPFQLSAWGLFNFGLLAGGHHFAEHWLFYQDFLQIFTEANPTGGLVYNRRWMKIQGFAVALGIIGGINRVFLGLRLGRKSYCNYAPQLAKLMGKMLLVSEVAVLAQQIEREAWETSLEKRNGHRKFLGLPSKKKQIPLFQISKQQKQSSKQQPQVQFDNLQSILNSTKPNGGDGLNDDESEPPLENSGGSSDNMDNGFCKIVEDEHPLSPENMARITRLLGEWEDPKNDASTHKGSVSISSILQFRRALERLVTDYPFSRAFGPADTRALCVASAQDVFLRLLLKTPESEGVLPFETIATLAVLDNGELDTEKARRLIKLFRPERDGSLSLLDFARSVDKVYKEVRMLSATIENNSMIDRALKKIFNIFFYSFLLVLILYIFGVDTFAMFAALSTVILTFAFMIGRSCSNYIEGLLLVLVQKPYGIGDHVNISDPVSESDFAGSQAWIVEDLNLFMTTFVMTATGEKATISNAALAQSRIINKTRSPKAKLFFTLKFGLGVPFKKIELFHECLVKFVGARPREWISLLVFRSTRVEADQGFVEYLVMALHRESWENMGAIQQSRAVLQQFALELQKKMDMKYVSPSLPVDIRMQKDVASHFKQGSHADNDSASTRAAPTLSSATPEPEPEDVSAPIFALFEGK